VVNETLVRVGGREFISRTHIGYISKGKFENLISFGLNYDELIMIAEKTKAITDGVAQKNSSQ
jgi:hypothetical protein